jgi:rfaE bifunctional protein nucleotidyltransferase chain/domain
MHSHSVLTDWDDLLRLRELWRSQRRTVVWTNGCFDLLHVGHVRSLQAARALGDVLVVGINSDNSVRALKGPDRPVQSQADRAEILAALGCVDRVIIFDEPTPEAAIARLQPNICCKGADYAPGCGNPVPEAGLVSSLGGRMVFLPLVNGQSTSAILRRVRGARA